MRLKHLAALCLSFACYGCAGSFEQPDRPATLEPPTSFYSDSDFKLDLIAYNTEVANGVYSSAKDTRNKMITLIAADIDYNYGEYKGKLHVGRAAIETVGDAASLGITAAITVVGGTALKSILGAADTALKGTMQSYSNNFYEEKATEILISSMDSIRTTQETQIVKNLDLPVTTYPFGQAKMDLIKLFFLGTREAGLAALEADAGKKADDAKSNAADAAQDRVVLANVSTPVTNDLEKMMSAMRNRVLVISQNGPGLFDEGVAILKRYDSKTASVGDIDAVVTALKALMAQAYKDHSKVEPLYRDFFPQ
jgi:hypothetical protein